MSGWDTDRDRLGLPQQPRQTWNQIDDFSPDRNPSASRLEVAWSSDDKTRLVMLAVRGLGVVCIATEAFPLTGKMQIRGASVYSKEEIGYAPHVI